MANKKNKWNMAGTAGLVLGGVCIAYGLLTLLTGKIANASTGLAFLLSLLNFALWAAKFVGCILLMKFFMKRYAASESGITNKDTFSFGVIVALLSALICSAFQYANLVFINPESINAIFDTILQQYSSSFDSNTLNQFDSIKDKMPELTFTMNFIYCFLFGVILSAILSANIPSRNPFKTDSFIDEQ